MAVNDVWNVIKKKLDGFLYAGEAEAPAPVRQEEMSAPVPDAAFTQQNTAYASGYYEAPQQPVYQATQQPAYQAPAAQAPQYHAHYQQQGYQPPQQPTPNAGSGRLGRFGLHKDNVVDIGDYQEKQAPAPAAENTLRQEPATTRVIGARGVADCRTAITLLRNGDAVLVTMESVKDPAEMRRLVDTLSGACYSLNASITKVSRFGVYLLAPATMAVFADPMINQMNGARPQQAQQAAQPQAGYQPQPRPNYQGYEQPQQPAYQQHAYRQESYQPQQPAYQQPRAQGEFTQRMAAPQENTGSFYARQQQQPVSMPAFSSPMSNAGYVPDDMEAAE